MSIVAALLGIGLLMISVLLAWAQWEQRLFGGRGWVMLSAANDNDSGLRATLRLQAAS
jgi:hypothetical protein